MARIGLIVAMALLCYVGAYLGLRALLLPATPHPGMIARVGFLSDASRHETALYWLFWPCHRIDHAATGVDIQQGKYEP